MRIKSITLERFKRFTSLTVGDLPPKARLIVVTGPNGSGKSGILEGLNYWRRSSGGFGIPKDNDYFPKATTTGERASNPVARVTFHDGEPATNEAKKKAVWIRSAYRHEADFASGALSRQPPAIDDPGVDRLLTVEQTVRKNYERLCSRSLLALYDPTNAMKKVGDLRDQHIGRVREAMRDVFQDLVLQSPGDPLTDGTFFFDKGTSSRFHYKNLSAGEKAAFDLLLDFLLRVEDFDNTVFAIDEPELHIGSAVQARLLNTLFVNLPTNCQLWIATHSIGMMRQALTLHKDHPDEVAFLDTFGKDFDQTCVLEPITPSRNFWKQCLAVALEDIADLVGPKLLVLCEGASPGSGFDATCYRAIFSRDFPEVEFISVGNSHEVRGDRVGVGAAVEILSPGTTVLRLIDRDDRSEAERAQLATQGVRVLSRRSIESYLLDDEILSLLCSSVDKMEAFPEIKAVRDRAIATNGQASDDFKSSAGAVQVFAKKQLGLRQSGSNAGEFLRTTMAPLVGPGTSVYEQLRTDVLGGVR
jgi:hypothetical protein